METKDFGVFINTGGQASRMRAEFPKALMQISGKPGTMLDNTVENLNSLGLTKFIFLTSTHGKADGQLIEAHAKAFYGPSRVIQTDIPNFSTEDEPLGTAGALYNGILRYGECEYSVAVVPDVTMNYRNINFNSMQGENVTFVVTSSEDSNQQNVGKIRGNRDHEVTQILEGNTMTTADLPLNDGEIKLTSTGMIVFKTDYFLNNYKKYINEMNPTGPVSLYSDFLPWLLKKGEKISFFDIKSPVYDHATMQSLQSGK